MTPLLSLVLAEFLNFLQYMNPWPEVVESYLFNSAVQCWILKDGKIGVESSSVQGCTTLHMICWQLHKCARHKGFLNRLFISTYVHYSIYAKYEGLWPHCPQPLPSPLRYTVSFTFRLNMYLRFETMKLNFGDFGFQWWTPSVKTCIVWCNANDVILGLVAFSLDKSIFDSW